MRLYNPIYPIYNINSPVKKVVTDRAFYRDPKLWAPRVKPDGPVRINWNHSLTKDLQFFVLPPRKDDLVNGLLPTETTLRYHVDRFGESLEGDPTQTGGNERYVYPVTSGGPLDLSNVSGKFTMFTYCWKIANNNGNVGIAGERNDTAAAGDWQWDFNAADYRFLIYDTAWQIADGGWNMPTGPLWLGLAVVGDGSGVYRFMHNGSFTTDTTVVPGTPTDDFALCNTSTGRGEALDGHMYVYAIWHRSLSNSELLSLYLDPYQFLTPA